VTDQLRRNGSLAELLGGALRDGAHGLSAVPGLLKQVLAEESWRELVTQRGDRFSHPRIEEYIRAQPLAGLGATVELVDRVIGTDDPDLLRLWRNARKGKPGRKAKGVDSTPIQKGEDSALTSQRLAERAPGEYDDVRRGEKTINAAAVAAGIRPHRISVRLDRPESIARSLRRHMSPEQLSTLARLLTEEV
jgi:hypothetical protein